MAHAGLLITLPLLFAIAYASAAEPAGESPGPELLTSPGGADGWAAGNGAEVAAGGEGVALELVFPARSALIGPDNDFMSGTSSPVVTRTPPQPLDLSPWDVVVLEATQHEIEDAKPGTIAVRLWYKPNVSIFAFLTQRPGERTRRFVDLRWYSDFEPSNIERLTMHKLYTSGDDAYTVHRLRPAHRAVVQLWGVQERLHNINARSVPSPDRQELTALTERADALEADYWDRRTTGPALAEAVEEMNRRIGQIETARVESLAKDHAQQAGVEGFVTVTAPPTRRLPLAVGELDAEFADAAEWSAAGNEHESVQVAVVPLGEPLEKVSWSVSPLKHADGATVPVTARLVGYVQTMAHTRYEPAITNPAWRADVLWDTDSVDGLPADEVMPLWLTAKVPAEAPAGEYRGTLTISAAGLPDREVPLTLRVWPFTLPDAPALRTALGTPSRFMVPVYGEARYDKTVRQAEDLVLKQYKLDPGNIYSDMPPDWDAERLRELVDAGLPGINLAFLKKDIETIHPQLDAAEEYLKVVDEVGVRDLCYFYGYDEWGSDAAGQVNDVAKHLAQRFPDIPLMTTLRSTQYGAEFPDGGQIGIYVPRLDNLYENAERAAAAREAGREVWFYTCVGPDHPFPNFFIDWPLIDTRLMLGALPAHNDADGFLYYAMARWDNNNKPMQPGRKHPGWSTHSYRGTNGDGSLLYPGPDGPVASLRLENMRDGIEDLAYYKLLRERLAAAGKPDAAAGRVSDDVLHSAADFSHDPNALAAERQRVAELIVQHGAGKSKGDEP